MFPQYTPEQAARFHNRVDRSQGEDACWNWTGPCMKNGYSLTRWGDKNALVHRAAYQIAYGNIPADLCVCHHCDNRRCCNPSHLFLGTKRDNTLDMMQKNRGKRPVLRGESHGSTKYSDELVMKIRNRYSSGGILQKDLASEYGLSREYISALVNYKFRK